MVNRIKTCYVALDFDSDFRVTPVMLRGFLAHLFTNIPEFHHHSEHSYHYPLIQYKKIKGKLAVIGIKEFADVVFQSMSDLDHITTETKKIPLNNIEIKNNVYQSKWFTQKYKFISPWIALNEKNYSRFKNLKNNEKRPFLEKILIGNILSMLKGLGIFVNYEIKANIFQYRAIPVIAHNNNFAGFYMTFESNIDIPEYVGLGKSVSKGFGVVEKTD